MDPKKRLTSDLLLQRLIESVGIFTGIDRADLLEVLGSATRESYAAGEWLFSEGEPGEAMFIIARGRLKVTRRRPDGSEMLLAEIQAGDTIGELALLDAQPRSASVRAIEDTNVLIIHRKAIREKSSLAAVIYQNLARTLAHRLRQTNQSLLAQPWTAVTTESD